MAGVGTADVRLEEQVPIISYESEMHILQKDIQLEIESMKRKETD